VTCPKANKDGNFFQEDILTKEPIKNELKKDASAFFTSQNTQQCDMTISTLLK
jgi:hypothetical protein